MRHLTAFTLSLFICCFNVQGQNFPLTDSLQRELASAKSDEQKVFWLGELARWSNVIDPQKASAYSQKQLKLAAATVNPKAKSQAYSSQTWYYLTRVPKNFDSANYFANKAISLGEQEKNNEYKAWGTLMLSVIQLYQGQPDKALQYATGANKLATTLSII